MQDRDCFPNLIIIINGATTRVDADLLLHSRVSSCGGLVGQGVDVLHWIHPFGNVIHIDVIDRSIGVEERNVVDPVRIGMHDGRLYDTGLS